MANLIQIDVTQPNWRKHVEALAASKRDMHVTGIGKDDAHGVYQFLLTQGYESIDIDYHEPQKRMEVWYRRFQPA